MKSLINKKIIYKDGKARYYVPRWGRWLTPDNPRYLELGNINGLNLFVCCNNSPIFMIDRGECIK